MTEPGRRKWGRAGERLDVAEADRRLREVVARANQGRAAQLASDQAAYPRWRAGLVVPFRITMALDLRGLYGPEVDTACLAREPEVDQWEAGERYPSWWQLLALARLTGFHARWFVLDGPPPPRAWQTSMWFHMSTAERRAYEELPAPVGRYPRAVLDARPASRATMPDCAEMPTRPEPLSLPLLSDKGDQLSLFASRVTNTEA